LSLTARTQTINRTQRGVTFSAAFKAGILGGFAISLLLVVRQLAPIPLLQVILIPPALVIIWVLTGIGAAMFCDDRIQSAKDGARVGTVAGIIAGTLGGITAMILAAFSLFLQDYGQGTLAQIPDTNLLALTELGFNEELVVLSGSILTALFACGLGGIVITALLGRFGGWLYTKFS
jgi:hypothetical protein